jgi:hypothetical protein
MRSSTCLGAHPPDEIEVQEWNDERRLHHRLAKKMFIERAIKLLCRHCKERVSFEPYFHVTTDGYVMHQVVCSSPLCKRTDYVMD